MVIAAVNFHTDTLHLFFFLFYFFGQSYTRNLGFTNCCRFGHVYNTLQTRLTKTLLNALLDPKRALTQHYGAVQGLAALGPNVVYPLSFPLGAR